MMNAYRLISKYLIRCLTEVNGNSRVFCTTMAYDTGCSSIIVIHLSETCLFATPYIFSQLPSIPVSAAVGWLEGWMFLFFIFLEKIFFSDGTSSRYKR